MNQRELISELKSIDHNELKNFLESRKVKQDRVKQKSELEEMILTLLLNEFDLIGLASEEIEPKNISDTYRTAFQKLFECEPNEASIYASLKDELNYFAIKNKYNGRNSAGKKTLLKILHQHDKINKSIVLDETISSISVSDKDVLELYSELQTKLENEIQEKETSGVQTFSDALKDIISEIESELKGKTKPIRSNSFPSLNKLCSIRPGNLIGIAGSYKSGKSSFATSLLLDFANQGIGTCIFSLELGKREITSKIASYKRNINYNHLIESSSLTDLEMAELSRLLAASKDLPLFITTEMLTLNQIKAKMKLVRDKKGVQVFAIDYLGYVRSDNNDFKNREREMTFFSVQLKKFAKELNVVVIVLAQLNRSGLTEPSSINLAESISLARDVDYLFTISTGEALKDNPNFRNILSGNLGGRFIVRLDTSRHSQQGKAFIIGFAGNSLKEISLNEIPENDF